VSSAEPAVPLHVRPYAASLDSTPIRPLQKAKTCRLQANIGFPVQALKKTGRKIFKFFIKIFLKKT
jgi:hypothetical protein